MSHRPSIDDIMAKRSADASRKSLSGSMSGTTGAMTEETGNLRVNRLAMKENGEHVYAAAMSHDGRFLATTFGNGCIRVLDAGNGFAPVQRAKLGQDLDDLPSTGVKWRPPHGESEPGVYELASVSSGGAAILWNFDAGDPDAFYLDRVAKIAEKGNETSCVDFSPDGLMMVTAGSDRSLRLYDPTTRKLTETMDKGRDETGHSRPAHTNRIFSVRYATPQIIISGGWEAPLQIWDVRTGKSERQIGGPQVASDAIEVNVGSQEIHVASNRQTKQLQVYDYLSGREIVSESDKLCKNLPEKVCMNSVRFVKESSTVWCIGSKPDCLIHMDATSGEVNTVVDNLGQLLCLTAVPGKPHACIVGGYKEALYHVEVV